MQSLSRLKPVLHAAIACAILVAVCALWIDKPVEFWVVHHQKHMLFWEGVASPSLAPLPCAIVFFAYYALRRGEGLPFGAYADLLLPVCMAVAVATIAKDELKWIIGRPWPYAWVRIGAYAIRPFTLDFYHGGFPSGHTTYIAAPMFVLWWRLPRYRAVWLGLIVLVMAGLVLSGHHWVGDCVGGFFLGLAAAAGTLAVTPQGFAAHRPAGALPPVSPRSPRSP